ncbi:hypothetical protein FAIPA1_190031 [Frankia sp. AiPs1]
MWRPAGSLPALTDPEPPLTDPEPPLTDRGSARRRPHGQSHVP